MRRTERTEVSNFKEVKILKTKMLVLVSLAVFVLFIGIWYFGTYGVGSIKPKDVTVAGTVTTLGIHTTPEKITFTSLSNKVDYPSDCNVGNPSYYSISVPNGQSYNVTITWKYVGLTNGGTVDAGTLNLDETQSSITRNWAR